MSKTSYHRERYGEWAGNPNGYPPIPEQCAEEIPETSSGVLSVRFRQCSRKRGHGPEGAFCKQHAKMHADQETAFTRAMR